MISGLHAVPGVPEGSGWRVAVAASYGDGTGSLWALGRGGGGRVHRAEGTAREKAVKRQREEPKWSAPVGGGTMGAPGECWGDRSRFTLLVRGQAAGQALAERARDCVPEP